MGIEIDVDNLEDMCALMCDNIIPRKKGNMTREEAIKVLNMVEAHGLAEEAKQMAIQALSQEPCDDTVSIRKDVLKCRVGNIVAYNVEWLKKHWQMEMDIVCGVKPCTDAVSRDAVYNILKEYHIDEEEIESAMDECQNLTVNGIASDVSLLPSVTHKSGKWIDYRDDGFVECPFCGHATNCEDDIDELHYCFYCGAKMESEEE